MKARILFILFSLSITFTYAQVEILKHSSGKFGLKDKSGTVVVEPRFDNISRYSSIFRAELNGKSGVFDEKGVQILSVQYDDLFPLEISSISYTRLIKVKQNNKWGIATVNDQMVLPCKYDQIRSNYTAMKDVDVPVMVKLNGKAGLVNLKDEVVVPIIWDDAEPVEGEGYFIRVKKGTKWTVVDLMGKPITTQYFDEIGRLSEGVFAVRAGSLWGVLENTGKVVIPATYDYIGECNYGRIKASKKGRWGFLDKTGKITVPFTFSEVNDFYQDFVQVVVGDSDSEIRFGVVDLNGQEKVSPTFAFVRYGNANGEFYLQQSIDEKEGKVSLVSKAPTLLDNERPLRYNQQPLNSYSFFLPEGWNYIGGENDLRVEGKADKNGDALMQRLDFITIRKINSSSIEKAIADQNEFFLRESTNVIHKKLTLGSGQAALILTYISFGPYGERLNCNMVVPGTVQGEFYSYFVAFYLRKQQERWQYEEAATQLFHRMFVFNEDYTPKLHFAKYRKASKYLNYYDAIKEGTVEDIETLYLKGVKVVGSYKEGKKHALLDAYYLKKFDVVEFFLQSSYDFNNDKEILPGLIKAPFYGDTTFRCFDKLLVNEELLAKMSKYGSPMSLVAEQNKLPLLKYFISKGVNVNARDEYGITALHNAVSNGNYEMVKFLIEKGADPTMQTWLKSDAFALAKEYKQKEILAYLKSVKKK